MLKQLKNKLKFLAVPAILVMAMGGAMLVSDVSVAADCTGVGLDGTTATEWSIGCAVGDSTTGEDTNASTIRGVINNIVRIVSFIVAAVSVLFIVIGAARWMGGDEENGKKQIQNALIGLVIVIFAYLIATWVIGLLGNVEGDLSGGATTSTPTAPVTTPSGAQ